ncbi:MAG TPA: hypothetical protein VG498_23080 [Terriglobales bacterium]|nr:hypothetical protein [Terriglobales bacterium]
METALQDEILRGPSPESGWFSGSHRKTYIQVLLCAAFALVDPGLTLSAQSLNANSGTTARPVVEPPIPNSSVATSGNCDRIAYVAGQLQNQIEREDLQRIQGPQQFPPLTPSGKFHLAVRNFSDPINIGGTAADAAISNALSDSTSAFGTGWSGFGKRFGMAMADNAVSEFFSTFVVASLAHQDPHYHRNPGAGTGKRVVYALSRVLIARSDYGKPMFNYSEVVGTTTASLVQNAYRYDRDQSPGAVSSRIVVSIGFDAAWNLMNEFLPDIAQHVNPRFFFLRRIAERAAKQH